MKRALVRLLVGAALVYTHAAAHAHPDHAWDAIRLVVHEFATALVNDDVATLARTLQRDGDFLGQGRDGYLAGLADGADVSSVIIEHATYEPVAGGVRVAPIVALVGGGTFRAWAAKVGRVDGEWRLVALEPTQELPNALPNPLPSVLPNGLLPGGLAGQTTTIPVTFSLIDAQTQAPVSARVHIADAHGDYWPPRGHQKHIRLGWREDVGGDVHLAGKTYAYVPPSFSADLPEGEFTITVAKGMEYETSALAFAVTNRPAERQVAVARWANMQAKGWYAGDTHVHFLDDHTALLELQAEDLNVINVLATKWGELAEHVTGAPSPLSTPERVVYFNEETRHGWLGHTILHRLRTLVYPLSWGGPLEGVPGGFDFPPMAYQADRAHAQGGMVTWAHFPFPGGELAVDVALGKIDSVDLFTWGDAFSDLSGPNGATVPGSVSLWYKFLNTGFKLPATAGTDKMLNVQVVGSVRTYARVDGAFSYDAWLDAIRSGRTFVTTGPLLGLTANGKRVGDTIELAPGDRVEIDAEVQAPFDRYAIDALEIVVGGRVVAAAPNADRKSALRVSARLRAERSSWIAARARGRSLLPFQVWPRLGAAGGGVPPMAHTSPIYLVVGGEPTRSSADARVLAAAVERAVEWAKHEARFQRDEERAEMVALFESARQVYVRQIDP